VNFYKEKSVGEHEDLVFHQAPWHASPELTAKYALT
jgi:hypothetical protein